MRILVVGGGGREHALCWAIAASPLTTKLFCAPGNAGIAEEAECVAIAADDIEGLVAFAVEQKIDFVVVGPEAPLVLGLVDRLAAAGIKAFGPSAAAAALEGSKGFMKDLCAKHGIPTAAYARFTEPGPAKAYVAGHRAARGRQGRWARRRQGGGDRRDAGRGHGGHRQHDGRPGLRRSGGRAGDRGVPGGRGAQLLRPGRRQDRPPARLRPGSQARRRRRHRPQYRRDGRLFPGPGGDGGAGGGDHGRHHPAHGGGHGGGRAALQGRALCRGDADQGRPQAAGIQHPLRRSRNAR